MTLFVVAAIAFVGMTIVGLGLFGRPDQSRPRCRACNADARPAAWDSPPVCACGARLDRAGAVRTRGRIRRPRVAILGILVVGVAAGVAGLSRWMDENGRTWWDFAPMAVVNAGLRAQHVWAHHVVESRRARGLLENAAYADAFLAANAAAFPYSEEHQVFIDTVRSEWALRPFEEARLAYPMLNFDVYVSLEQEAPGATPGATVLIQPRLTRLQFGDHTWFFRLTSVTVDGADMPVQSEIFEGEPSRIIVPNSPSARVVVPATGGSTPDVRVVVDGYLVRTRAGLAVVADALVDSAAPPEEWGIDAIAIPVTHEVRLPRGTTAGSAARDAVP